MNADAVELSSVSHQFMISTGAGVASVEPSELEVSLVWGLLVAWVSPLPWVLE
jgi:hypothetical protein